MRASYRSNHWDGWGRVGQSGGAPRLCNGRQDAIGDIVVCMRLSAVRNRCGTQIWVVLGAALSSTGAFAQSAPVSVTVAAPPAAVEAVGATGDTEPANWAGRLARDDIDGLRALQAYWTIKGDMRRAGDLALDAYRIGGGGNRELYLNIPAERREAAADEFCADAAMGRAYLYDAAFEGEPWAETKIAACPVLSADQSRQLRVRLAEGLVKKDHRTALPYLERVAAEAGLSDSERARLGHAFAQAENCARALDLWRAVFARQDADPLAYWGAMQCATTLGLGKEAEKYRFRWEAIHPQSTRDKRVTLPEGK